MAYLYSSSKTWRRIVDTTARSGKYMLAFAAACVAVPVLLGDQVRGRGSSCWVLVWHTKGLWAVLAQVLAAVSWACYGGAV